MADIHWIMTRQAERTKTDVPDVLDWWIRKLCDKFIYRFTISHLIEAINRHNNKSDWYKDGCQNVVSRKNYSKWIVLLNIVFKKKTTRVMNDLV